MIRPGDMATPRSGHYASGEFVFEVRRVFDDRGNVAFRAVPGELLLVVAVDAAGSRLWVLCPHGAVGHTEARYFERA